MRCPRSNRKVGSRLQSGVPFIFLSMGYIDPCMYILAPFETTSAGLSRSCFELKGGEQNGKRNRHTGAGTRRTKGDPIQRLNTIYAGLPPKQKAIAAGLIIQAARLRVSLDLLAADIRENGLTEMFRQSDKVEPYTRERAATQIFAKMDKNYQGIISQLNKMVPAEDEPDDDLASFKRG